MNHNHTLYQTKMMCGATKMNLQSSFKMFHVLTYTYNKAYKNMRRNKVFIPSLSLHVRIKIYINNPLTKYHETQSSNF